MRSIELGCFKLCSWSLWKALKEKGCIAQRRRRGFNFKKVMRFESKRGPKKIRRKKKKMHFVS
jgi:hypothetical protein